MSNAIPTYDAFRISVWGVNTEYDTTLVSTWGLHQFTPPSNIVISNHCAQAVDRFIEQYEDKPLLEGLICCAVQNIQELEYVYSDLSIYRFIDSAVGLQLDGIGDIVVLPRTSLDDEIYRTDLKAKVGRNISSGEPEILIAYCKLLTGSDVVIYTEPRTATVMLYANRIINIPVNYAQLMNDVSPAGVRVESHINYTPGVTPFGFADEAGIPNVPSVLGFGELNYAPLDGGALIENK